MHVGLSDTYPPSTPYTQFMTHRVRKIVCLCDLIPPYSLVTPSKEGAGRRRQWRCSLIGARVAAFSAVTLMSTTLRVVDGVERKEGRSSVDPNSSRPVPLLWRRCSVQRWTVNRSWPSRSRFRRNGLMGMGSRKPRFSCICPYAERVDCCLEGRVSSVR
jgi:hypothetical protein